jgi:hypothetical protein
MMDVSAEILRRSRQAIATQADLSIQICNGWMLGPHGPETRLTQIFVRARSDQPLRRFTEIDKDWINDAIGIRQRRMKNSAARNSRWTATEDAKLQVGELCAGAV